MNLKCKKLTVETDGTTGKTVVKADGKKVSNVRRIDLKVDMDNDYVIPSIEMARVDASGKVMTKIGKVRDDSMRFVDKEKVMTEPLLIEFGGKDEE